MNPTITLSNRGSPTLVAYELILQSLHLYNFYEIHHRNLFGKYLVSYTNCFLFFISKYKLYTCVYVNCSGPVFVLNPMFCITESQAVSLSDLPPAHNSPLKIHQWTCTSIMHDLSEPIKAYKLLISIDVNMNGMYCVILLVNQ